MPRRATKVQSDLASPVRAPLGASKWVSVGWTLLLIGGLAHMLPQQTEPLLKWAMYGVTVQTAVGVVSVVIALYYLLGE